MSHLQEQSFITNLQAVNCASLHGMKLQNANISSNVHNLCRLKLKDFSPQGLHSLVSLQIYDFRSLFPTLIMGFLFPSIKFWIIMVCNVLRTDFLHQLTQEVIVRTDSPMSCITFIFFFMV